MSVQVREVSRFDQVRFRGPGSLKITQGDEESLTLHAPAYLIDQILSEVRDKTLHLGYISPKVHSLRVNREIISYQLCMKDVRRVVTTGSGRVLVPDLDNDVIAIELSGSGQLVMENLTADRLGVRVTGSGNIVVAGDVEAQTVHVSGSGNYIAERLVCDFAEIRSSGSGSVGISVSDDLQVSISGSGEVSYAGYPDVSKHISGSGRLVRRRRPKQNNQGEENVQ